jgi:hypothetical protein
MCEVLRRRGGAAHRTFETTFKEPDVRAYLFTFG